MCHDTPVPESKRRKPKFPPNPNKAIPRTRVTPLGVVEPDVPPPPRERRRHSPTREITAEQRYVLPVLPEAATYDQVLVALSELEPLAQEILLAERLSLMPNPNEEGPPVPIPRQARPGWAHQMRQLGVFVIPELATHQLADSVHGGPSSLRQMSREDLWDRAKAQNPALAKLVDGAKTPEDREKARKVLLARMPMEQQIAMEKLLSVSPEDLEPK